MNGYRNAPEETANTLRDGWLYTGDIGSIEVDDSLTIRGLKKEVIIVSGLNVFPREIEDVLLSHKGVSEAAVIGVPDGYRGEKILAFVVPADPLVSEEDLRGHCTANLTRYKNPASIIFRPALPKTSVGKVDKVELATQAQQAAATSS